MWNDKNTHLCYINITLCEYGFALISLRVETGRRLIIMTELEKLKYAKAYIDKLADGIDPISGEALPGDTILNNVRLSRCFFYVADVLRQVIENDGLSHRQNRRKPTLLPFSLPHDMRDQIEITETPTMIKHFTDRINGLVDDSVMTKLKVTALTTWLVNNGFLFEEIVNDKKRKKPTKSGEEIGVFAEVREGQYGGYLAILYSESAQRHIVKNLDLIIAISNGE